MKKTAGKTARPRLVPQPNGGALLAGGVPGNAGGGRPKDEFKQLCQRLASGEMTVQQVEEILKDRNHPQFIAALKWATEHGYGKATEHVEVNSSTTVYVVEAPPKFSTPDRWQQQFSRN